MPCAIFFRKKKHAFLTRRNGTDLRRGFNMQYASHNSNGILSRGKDMEFPLYHHADSVKTTLSKSCQSNRIQKQYNLKNTVQAFPQANRINPF